MSPTSRRPARTSPAASITLEKFEALDHVHIEIVQRLRQLEQLVERLDKVGGDADARALAASICAFFDDTARTHHEDEERVVFPPLLGSGDADLVQKVQRLQQDHGWIEEDWRELRAVLATVAEGHSGFDPVGLRQMGDVFATLCLEHIALEESLIYPESKRRQLDDAQAEQRRIAASP